MQPERFFALPEELQEQILSWRPDLIPALSQTSHHFRRLTNKLYSTVLGAQPHRPAEMDKVTDIWPPTMATVRTYKLKAKPEFYVKASIYHRELLTTNEANYMTNHLIVQLASQTGRLLSFDSSNEIIKLPKAASVTFTKVEVDLRRHHTIRKRRLGCMVRDPDYARKETIKLLDAKYQLNKSKRLGDLVELYVYMYVNANVLSVSPGEFMVVNVSNLGEALEVINQKLHHALTQHLLHLN